jgi:hypothetical protein
MTDSNTSPLQDKPLMKVFNGGSLIGNLLQLRTPELVPKFLAGELDTEIRPFLFYFVTKTVPSTEADLNDSRIEPMLRMYKDQVRSMVQEILEKGLAADQQAMQDQHDKIIQTLMNSGKPLNS